MADHYDIVIVGMGCAGSHIALEILRQGLKKRVAVIDDYQAQSLDKTWSYWEKGIGKWDQLTIQQWKKGTFRAQGESVNLDLGDYVYKSVESKDFIAFAKAEIQKSSYFTFINSKVNNVNPEDTKSTKGSNYRVEHTTGSVTASIVLDSRISPEFRKNTTATTLLQHFKGWVIKTEEESFDSSSFVMMDYDLKDEGTTSFFYILPYSKNQALIEFTYFSKEIVADKTYDDFLKKYIKDHLSIENYTIEKVEQGVIPMTSYDFRKHSKNGWIKVGTAGGWVKPSTGYSFKISEFKAEKLVHNIKNGKDPQSNLFSARHFLYDKTLLEVLHKHNGEGDKLFLKLYQNNPTYRLLDFLDDHSSLLQELKIMKSMTSMRFINGFLKSLK